MSSSGVSESHQNLIVQFLKFHRKRRSEFLGEVTQIFDDNKESRLHESTYTTEEVVEILDETSSVIRSDLENELMYTCHSMAVLLRQLVSQAEQWHLTLDADVGELNSKDKIAQIAKFEQQIERGENTALLPSVAKLNPIADGGGGTTLLKKEITKLKDELDLNKHKLDQSEQKNSNILKQNVAISTAYQNIKDRVNELEPTLQEKIEELKIRDEDVGKLTVSLGEANSTISEVKALGAENADEVRSELTKLKHEFLAKQSELQQLTKDLDTKITNTTQYQNMKKMLAKKNEMIKQMRKELKSK